jgi:hypothetical protein
MVFDSDIVVSAEEAVDPPLSGAHSEHSWLERRRWVLGVAGAFIATALGFTFWWGPVVEHVSQWVDSGDLWDTYRAAQWVGWGNEGTVYEHGIYSIVFPGITVLLAPVAMVASHFRLVNPYPYFVPKPSALPLLMPYVLVISVPALFAFDTLAESLAIGPARRRVLCWMQGALLWPVVVVWGHPEEALALAFAVWGLLAAYKGRWSRAGWLMGLAVAFQPYALLIVPILLGLAPKGSRLATAVRSVLLSCALLVLPFLQGWHATTHAIFVQPTILVPNHATPLLALAPHLAKGVYSAGPGRYCVVLVAVAAGWWTWKRQPGLREVCWMAALVLAARCLLEPVIAPYYLWSASVLLVTVSATQNWRRFFVTVGAVACASLWAYHFTSSWAYWLPIAVLLALAVKSAMPDLSLTRLQRPATGQVRV